jgi:hypothetical protein
MSEEDSDRISVQDAIRRKQDLNKSINGGYNAREIEELERLGEEQLATFRKIFSHYKYRLWLLPDWVMAIGFAIAGFSLFYFESLSVRLFCLLAMTYCVTQIAYRLGAYFGFERGFEEGHREGVHRVLGISGADASEIRDKA